MWFPHYCTPRHLISSSTGTFLNISIYIALLLPILLSLNFHMKSFDIKNLPAKKRVYRKTMLSFLYVCTNSPDSLGFYVLLLVDNWQLNVFHIDLCDNFDFHLPQKIVTQINYQFFNKLFNLFLSEYKCPTNKRIIPDIKFWNPFSR